MGAIIKSAIIEGPTVEKAFKCIQDNEQETFGHGADTYDNGGWHNHNGALTFVDRETFLKIEEANRDGEGVDGYDISKHGPVFYTEYRKPISNDMKIKSEVIRYPNYGTRKWETVYVAVPRYGRDEYLHVGIMEIKQADAIAKARAFVADNPTCPLRVQIGKRLVSKDTDAEIVAEITYKKSSRERDGQWGIIGCMPY